jgi:acetoin utilization deacetylase AcuC-like enzyme
MVWERIAPVALTREQALWTHTARYVDELWAWTGKPRQADPDTYVGTRSVEVARAAAGAVVALSERLAKATPAESRLGLALVRPPGHHARADSAMGFCLLNNIALAARAAQRSGLSRVAIVDFDVHHGNGTQEIFYEDPSVLYVSTHQFPFYPGTGSLAEQGEGKGQGYTLNVPLASGSDDSVYKAAFSRVVVPALRAFKPQMVLVSAGFDAAAEDPLAGMALSANAFGWITNILGEVAAEHAENRLALILEGGYDLPALERGLHASLLGACGTAFGIAEERSTEDVDAAVKAHAHWKGVS